MGKENIKIDSPMILNDDEDEIRMQEQPKVCGKMHDSCDRNPKCTCTTVCDAYGNHSGSHTSPFHIWF